jgi:predicted DNA-binding transcriptional regulator AlpA
VNLNGQAKDTSALLTAKDVAKLLNMSEKTLANWRSQNKGPPYIKFPGKNGKGGVRFEIAAVRKWQESNTKSPI